jgi:hypothetical protein
VIPHVNYGPVKGLNFLTNNERNGLVNNFSIDFSICVEVPFDSEAAYSVIRTYSCQMTWCPSRIGLQWPWSRFSFKQDILYEWSSYRTSHRMNYERRTGMWLQYGLTFAERIQTGTQTGLFTGSLLCFEATRVGLCFETLVITSRVLSTFCLCVF